MPFDTYDDDLTFGDLGPRWEEVHRALSAVQADLSATVANAPRLVLLWREIDAGRDGSDAIATEFVGPDARRVFVGKARDWYHGADGGVVLAPNYPSAVLGIAEQVSDAVADTLLGYYAYWPHCPADDYPLTAQLDRRQKCWWVCDHGDHAVAEVGHLAGL